MGEDITSHKCWSSYYCSTGTRGINCFYWRNKLRGGYKNCLKYRYCGVQVPVKPNQALKGSERMIRVRTRREEGLKQSAITKGKREKGVRETHVPTRFPPTPPSPVRVAMRPSERPCACAGETIFMGLRRLCMKRTLNQITRTWNVLEISQPGLTHGGREGISLRLPRQREWRTSN